MFTSIFIIVKVVGMLFLVCKAISFAGQVSDTGEVRNLMSDSLSMRAGIFSAKP
jgi:hypothetical protein